MPQQEWNTLKTDLEKIISEGNGYHYDDAVKYKEAVLEAFKKAKQITFQVEQLGGYVYENGGNFYYTQDEEGVKKLKPFIEKTSKKNALLDLTPIPISTSPLPARKLTIIPMDKDALKNLAENLYGQTQVNMSSNAS